MSDNFHLDKDGISRTALKSLLLHCKQDTKLKNDKNIHIVINMSKKMGIKNDNIPRVIPLSSCKINKPKDVRTLLLTKDPANLYRDPLTKCEQTSELFKEILGIKALKRRFRGVKLNQLYKEFDLVVADFRVLHLLPDILGERFYHGSNKLPYAIKMSRDIMNKGQARKYECDPIYIRAQLRSICKNTSYVPNNDNCLCVKVGEINKTTVDEILQNIEDVVKFLIDKSKKPQGGVIKGNIKTIFVKTTNSPSLPIYEETRSTVQDLPKFDLRL